MDETLKTYLEHRLVVLRWQKRTLNRVTNQTYELNGAIAELEHVLAAAEQVAAA